MARLAIGMVLGAAAFSACGGDGGPSGPSPPANPYVISITAGGIVSPRELQVPAGTRVLFVNNHSRPHTMTSDPHPDHDDCPPINRVGLLGPGQSDETDNLVTAGTCGFHDHDDPGNAGLQGRIVIR